MSTTLIRNIMTSANQPIDKQHIMRRREQYLTDPYLQALSNQHLKVIQHSRIGLDRDGNIVCDTIGQQLLDKIETLRANHIESNYPECLI